MSQQTIAPLTAPTAPPARWKQLISLDNRYVAPIFITCILLAGHLSFGILESYQKTLLAIAVSIGTELLLGRRTQLERRINELQKAPKAQE